jgi:threonine synthase
MYSCFPERLLSMFFSTRDSKISVTASTAILKGISDEGGLFLPEEIKRLDVASLLDKPYEEIAYEVLRLYLDDFTDEEIKTAVKKAYSQVNFPEKVAAVSTFGNHSFLELFHGLTLTFKDMALSLLPELMEISLKKYPEEQDLHILTATSGDTGSAVLSSFSHSEHISASILYPDNGVSYIQEKQMLSFTSPKSRAYAFKGGNFDDCQTLIKKILVEKPKGLNFTSANSINIGRLLPQIVYYYFAYTCLVKNGVIKNGEKIDVVVPTGNFGDIFAAYLAKRMSLPFNKLVIASNSNRILTDFFQTGIYDVRRDFKKTNSPSMDILISSNLERLLYLTCLDDKKVLALENDLKTKGSFKVDKDFLNKLQNDFVGFSADEEETLKAIKKSWDEEGYLLDPHTAVGYASYLKYQGQKSPLHALIVATASPLKFPLTILKALNIKETSDLEALNKVLAVTKFNLPPQLKQAINSKPSKYIVDERSFRRLLAPDFAFEVKAPASSANLGPGFDVCGTALSLFNTFSFKKAKKDNLIGFKGEEETKDNLVLKAYQRYFAKFGFPYQPVEITQVRQDVPISRGLGSSSTCIIAGLLAADQICQRPSSREDILTLATEIEGHPDNVSCCLLGGFVASYKNKDGKIVPNKYPISEKLGFVALVPDQELSTALARGALLKSYPLNDVTYDASRLINLPRALKEADLVSLKDLLDDKIHVPYRLGLIKDAEKVQKIAEEYQLPFTISGAGSTLLMLYRVDQEEILNQALTAIEKTLPQEFKALKLKVCLKGAEIRRGENHGK